MGRVRWRSPVPCVMRPDENWSLSPLISMVNVTNGRMAEVGSYAGESTLMFASCGKFASIYAIDPWNNKLVEALLRKCDMSIVESEFNKRLEPYQEKIHKIKATSEDASHLFKHRSLDLVYIDGNHTYEAVKHDIVLWRPKVKIGGFIAGHDYGSNHPGVVQAVNEAFPNIEIEKFPDRSWLVKII